MKYSASVENAARALCQYHFDNEVDKAEMTRRQFQHYVESHFEEFVHLVWIVNGANAEFDKIEAGRDFEEFMDRNFTVWDFEGSRLVRGIRFDPR
jgi:hypothetical protein